MAEGSQDGLNLHMPKKVSGTDVSNTLHIDVSCDIFVSFHGNDGNLWLSQRTWQLIQLILDSNHDL